jgi:hypothetical protein
MPLLLPYELCHVNRQRWRVLPHLLPPGLIRIHHLLQQRVRVAQSVWIPFVQSAYVSLRGRVYDVEKDVPANLGVLIEEGTVGVMGVLQSGDEHVCEGAGIEETTG